MEVLSPRKIIVRMPNWLGDCVMATPVLEDLASFWPECTLTVLCQAGAATLLENSPFIHEIIIASSAKSRWFHRYTEKRKLIRQIKKGKFDLGILLTNSFSTAWCFFRAGVTCRIGFANDFRSCLLSKAVPFPKSRKNQHLVYTYKELLKPLGIENTKTVPSLYSRKEEERRCHNFLQSFGIKENTTLIGINATAAYGPAKCWLPERFTALAKRLLEDDPTSYIVFIGDQSSKNEIAKIIEGLPPQVINLAGSTNLQELVAVIKRCQVFVTNDSGPMHVAAACKTSLVAIFGSTSDIVTPPFEHGRIIHKHVPCSPCYKRVCPIDFPCMKEITVDEVFQITKEELNKKI